MWSRTGSFCLEYEGAHRSCSLSVGACFYYSEACAAAGRHLNIKTVGTRSCILSRPPVPITARGLGATHDATALRYALPVSVIPVRSASIYVLWHVECSGRYSARQIIEFPLYFVLRFNPKIHIPLVVFIWKYNARSIHISIQNWNKQTRICCMYLIIQLPKKFFIYRRRQRLTSFNQAKLLNSSATALPARVPAG